LEKKRVAKTRTEFFIETTEIYVIRRKRVFVRVFCDECGREVTMISPTEAALIMCQTVESIFSLIDKNRIHFRYLEKETPLVCLRSICLA
jgi:hypothetical protein